MATLRSRTKFNLSLVTLTLRLRRPSPARMCRRKRPQGAQSHAERRVRPDAQAVGLGLGGTPTSEPEYPKRIFRLIACLRYKSILRLILALSKNAKTEKAALFSQNSLYSSVLIAPSIAASMMGRYLSKH